MKRLFTLLATGMMLYAEGHAQVWPKPELEASEFVTGQECYLFNVEANRFYTEGNAWGTQGSIGNTGLKCRFENYAGSDGTDGQIVSMTNYSIVKQQWMTPYITTNGALYVDGISQEDHYWQIVPSGDKTFKLKVSAPNPIYNQDNYPDAMLGLDLFEDSTRTVLASILMEAEEPGEHIYLTEWCIATPAAYEQYQLDVETYDTAQALKDLLTEASQKGKDVTEEQTVYNNTESTLDELNAAISSVTYKLLEDYIGDASVDNPIDVTNLFITNPGYDNNNNDGWSGSIPGTNVSENVQNAEFFNTNFDYYQDLKNLPEGYYKLNVQGFYRAGLPEEAITHKQENEDNYMYAELYATTGGNTATQKLQSIFNEATDEPLGTSGEILTGSYYIPNGMAAAGAYFSAGRYKENSIILHITNGKLRIGIRKNTTLRRDWVMFDNWSLTYYGTENPNFQL